MLTKIKSIVVASLGSAVLVGALSAAALANNLNFIPLTLINGWTYYAAGTRFPTGAIDKDGVVHLRGALYQSSGSNTIASVTPMTWGLRMPASPLGVDRSDVYTASQRPADFDVRSGATVDHCRGPDRRARGRRPGEGRGGRGARAAAGKNRSASSS